MVLTIGGKVYERARGRRIGTVILACTLFIAGTRAVEAQEVNGIYTESTTKDLGEVTGKKSLKGIKFRGWFEAYIEHNFNDPNSNIVNSSQSASVVKAKDLKIEGRTFDVHSDSFSLLLTVELAETRFLLNSIIET